MLFNLLPFLYQFALGFGDALAMHFITFCVPSFIMASPLNGLMVVGVISVKKARLYLKHQFITNILILIYTNPKT